MLTRTVPSNSRFRPRNLTARRPTVKPSVLTLTDDQVVSLFRNTTLINSLPRLKQAATMYFSQPKAKKGCVKCQAAVKRMPGLALRIAKQAILSGTPVEKAKIKETLGISNPLRITYTLDNQAKDIVSGVV